METGDLPLPARDSSSICIGIVSHVAVSSFAKRWFGKPLPPAFTTDWYTYAWTNFELGHVLFITLFIALSVVFIALLIGFPAAYILARRNFRAKPHSAAVVLLAAAHSADDLRHPARHHAL